MNKVIFVDDERNPADVTWIDYNTGNAQWIVVRTFNEFKQLIDGMVSSGQITSVVGYSFDHDLMDFDSTGTEFTGCTCVNYLAQVILDNDLPIPDCYFHTQNQCGRQNMQSVLTSLKRFRGQ